MHWERSVLRPREVDRFLRCERLAVRSLRRQRVLVGRRLRRWLVPICQLLVQINIFLFGVGGLLRRGGLPFELLRALVTTEEERMWVFVAVGVFRQRAVFLLEVEGLCDVAAHPPDRVLQFGHGRVSHVRGGRGISSLGSDVQLGGAGQLDVNFLDLFVRVVEDLLHLERRGHRVIDLAWCVPVLRRTQVRLVVVRREQARDALIDWSHGLLVLDTRAVELDRVAARQNRRLWLR